MLINRVTERKAHLQEDRKYRGDFNVTGITKAARIGKGAMGSFVSCKD